MHILIFENDKSCETKNQNMRLVFSPMVAGLPRISRSERIFGRAQVRCTRNHFYFPTRCRSPPNSRTSPNANRKTDECRINSYTQFNNPPFVCATELLGGVNKPHWGVGVVCGVFYNRVPKAREFFWGPSRGVNTPPSFVPLNYFKGGQ